MKKVIIAVAVVLTTSVLTIITKDNASNTQAVKFTKTSFLLDKNVTGTAD